MHGYVQVFLAKQPEDDNRTGENQQTSTSQKKGGNRGKGNSSRKNAQQKPVAEFREQKGNETVRKREEQLKEQYGLMPPEELDNS